MRLISLVVIVACAMTLGSMDSLLDVFLAAQYEYNGNDQAALCPTMPSKVLVSSSTIFYNIEVEKPFGRMVTTGVNDCAAFSG